jgi:DNA-binding LytR/AlgR family response regulator
MENIHSNLKNKGKIIIIEDEFFAAEHLKDIIQSFGFRIVAIYHSGIDFFKQTDWNFDAAILDIYLADEKYTGIDIAYHLKEKQKPFIFLTANQDSQTLREAAKLTPSSYLSKPFKTKDIQAALEIISYKITPKITLRSPNGLITVNTNDILYIKSEGAYIKIYTTKEIIIQRKLLKEFEKELPSFFTRVHRSFLINTNHLNEKASNYIKIGKIEIPLSRKYKGNL